MLKGPANAHTTSVTRLLDRAISLSIDHADATKFHVSAHFRGHFWATPLPGGFGRCAMTRDKNLP
jgi:hypothetical protein